MAIPKSVVKISKNNVTFTSSVDKANYTITELTRAALRDACRLIKNRYRTAYYSTFKQHTKQGPRAISYKVYSSKKVSPPEGKVGIQHSHPGKKVPGFYTFFHEVGTVKEPKQDLLKRTVEANIDEIRKVEAQYLSAISDEAAAINRIGSEDDYEG